MDNRQAIENLRALRKFHNQFVEDNEEINNSFSKELVEALDIAIKALERTTLEVPVQGQWIGECQYCCEENKVYLPSNKGIVPKFCMSCGRNTIYQKNPFL